MIVSILYLGADAHSMSTPSIDDWFKTPLGQYVLSCERAYFTKTAADIFGFHAIQIGMCYEDFLDSCRMPHRFSAGIDAGKVYLKNNQLPFANQSVDLVILPHVLEFSDEPHPILREVERILVPDGQVLLSGFNPFGLFGLMKILPKSGQQLPWSADFISLVRVKDWLALLNFEVVGGRFACYTPPFAKRNWINRFVFMEKAGDRWWGIAGGVYFLQARKKVLGMRLIRPEWQDKSILAARKRAASQRECGCQKEVV
ncbi:MAG: methyltransferase domain-containing protein [Proteobacteria bacterium]|nr:methyltransferase domain-containing protein [Pseudomonadota bacterium]MDE3207697.1 methyltransferase domain-containing protein [Pseudomonadota bacterium]